MCIKYRSLLHSLALFILWKALCVELQARPLVNANLSQQEAIERGALVQDVDYRLSIQLTKSDKSFSGEAQISFQLKKQQGTFLDFHGGDIHKLLVNGHQLRQFDYDGRRIQLPAKLLKKGANLVVVNYSRPFSRTGSGFYRFEDPEDQEVYLWTQFEPFDANQLFPAFDQPDLKASYILDVKAPKDWQVISASREDKLEQLKDGRKHWFFPQTERFSTYIFSLHAGPYTMWEDKSASIPMRLFARKSLAPYVVPADWFTITKQGFEFFNAYFAYPYPFHKYDQIIVPDFNAGAMENVASVTFSERFIKRRASTYEERRSLANTILHELAHMWFGNLVTMKWWNDLWLNESFATYMAHLSLVEATEFKDSWQSFFRTSKSWAYWTDQLNTTHPIEAEIPDTTHAFSNFDGITYGKGAAFLKLLHHYVGKEQFQKGLHHYFKTHAYQNTVREDFIRSISLGYGKELDQFANEWLGSAGVNTITATALCDKKTIKAIQIQQKAVSDHPKLRSHASKVALLYPAAKNRLVVGHTIEVQYQGEETEIAVKGNHKCPSLVYPNMDDHDYVIVDFAKDLTKWQRSIGQVEDPFLRLMIWRDLWESVLRTQLDAFSFADLVLRQLAKEDDYHIQAFMTRTLVSLNQYLEKAKQRQDLSKGAIARQQRIKDLVWNITTSPKTNEQLRLNWLDTYLSFAYEKTAAKTLLGLYEDKIKLPGIELDQDMKWELLKQLSAIGEASTEERLKRALENDKSIRAQRNAIAVNTIQPKMENKLSWIKKAVDNQEAISVAERRMILSSIFPSNQDDLRLQFSDEYYRLFPEVINKFPPHIAAGIIQALAPLNCTNENFKKFKDFVAKQDNLSKPVDKSLKNLLQEDERCLAILQRTALDKV